jgi:hypothetical protein
MNTATAMKGITQMTKSTIDMAREVKATAYTNRHYPDRTTYTFGPEQLKAFEALVRADEREQCALIAEDSDHVVGGRGYYDQLGNADATVRNIAAAIRNRGTHEKHDRHGP